MGGGHLRSAAKAAIFSQYRSPVRFFDLPSSSSLAPASGARSKSAPPPSISPLSGDNGRWLSWEVDDWEFVGWKEEEDADDYDADLGIPATRLVFGQVPTLAEAKEATSDLKVALDKVYFSSTNADDNEKLGRGPNIVESSSIVPPMPRPVVQAFSLLQESPEAQSVAASLACDKNVWDAVMKNEKVMEFYRNRQPTSTESVAQNALAAAEGSSENFRDISADNSVRSVLTDVMKNMKNNAREMVSSISNFLQDFFLATETYCTTIMRGSNSHFDATGTSSFIALAIAVILVVLVKRGSS
ncbi:uncharacterized protein LOC109724627 [Ananas comosus]|uniref:Uncharacterized protein LOC109724627 n=1 Tax=Ananas comosus TaxID=4615 RepID=A0A6P5GMT5_ANACO|nr:uncharacterized protein LOC109724627 [Ananas comosus]